MEGTTVTDLYPSTTNEPVPEPITEHGTIVTTGVNFSIVPDGQQAGTWVPAVILDGVTCFVLVGKSPGVYRKWAQITSGSYVVVLDCGTVTVV
jgi:hypothetical protein